MFARTEDPYLPTVIAYLSTMQRQVTTRASATVDLDQRFYLDALAELLTKTQKHIPDFFPSESPDQKNAIVASLKLQYELIHLDHKKRVSFLTGLKAGEALTVDAIRIFYEDNARSLLHARDERAPHTMILYNNGLYHYNYTDPNNPVLTPVTINLADQTQQAKLRQHNYKHLKAHINSLWTDRVYTAAPVDPEHQGPRNWIAGLIPVPVDVAWRQIDFALVARFIPRFESMLINSVRKWRETKQDMVKSAAGGARLIVGALVLNLAIIVMTRSLFTSLVIPMAKVILVLKMAMALGLLVMAVGLAAALFCYFKETASQRRLHDVTNVDFSKTYPTDMAPRTVKQPLPTFFSTHQRVLETAFPVPVPHI